MRTRHKPPALVSMWMLDVFCCALGCVTLLWLLNNRVATLETTRAASALADLASTRADLDATKLRLTTDIDDLKAKLLATTTERDDAARRLAVARTDVASLETKLAKDAAVAKALADELQKKRKDAADLTLQVASATTAAEELAKLLRTAQRDREDVALKATKAEEQLNDLDAKLRTAQKTAADATATAAAMRKSGDELTAARAAARDLQQKLDSAAANIIDLQGDKAKLADKFDKLKVETDSKFAGIAMTGKRVVFLVDASGSMKLIDEKTPAPDKWPTVVDTVAKVMRTIPDLDQYQVVVFSRTARYLFGTGEWRPYRGEATLTDVRAALKAVDPVGDTNLYDGLDLAFRLKATGLDTVYLFSDGLPTSGPGLTPEQERTFGDSQRTESLAKHLRRTLGTTWNPPGRDRVKVNAVGFFYESPEVGAFLWALARENAGSFVGMSRP